jgi:pimeloyl-ACP methyl ester carboxylesterase
MLDAFRKADWDEQERMLADEGVAREIESWLGTAAFDELKQLASASHLGAGKKNLIVVPGVMGSMLQSSGTGGIWWLDVLRARDKLNALALSADGVSDADVAAEIEACALDITYAPMRAAIATSDDFGGSVQFPYDWRKPLEAAAPRLRDLIVRLHQDYGREPVHLVGHSMGGLMIRTTLMRYGDQLWPKIGKIVFIATPHYGSPSIAGYLKNHLWGWEQMAVLGTFLSRETFRSLWGVLSLLPAPASIYPATRNGEAHPCGNLDFYDADAYRLGLEAPATLRLQRALDAARVAHTDLFNWHRGLTPSERQRMLQITGVGRKTLFRLEIGAKWLGLWQNVTRVTARIPGDANRDGDGRVPVAAADLENIEIRYVKGEHGSMQNIPAVVRDTLAWIADRPLSLADSPKAALAAHLSGEAGSSAPHLDGSAAFSPYDDEYDRYRDLSESQIKELVGEWEAGRLPGLDRACIL